MVKVSYDYILSFLLFAYIDDGKQMAYNPIELISHPYLFSQKKKKLSITYFLKQKYDPASDDWCYLNS